MGTYFNHREDVLTIQDEQCVVANQCTYHFFKMKCVCICYHMVLLGLDEVGRVHASIVVMSTRMMA